ncbi:MAG: prepilin-type N-terminal cleavage/methylation domain-containing protein [Planctomycetes bacterium]|nr:prepilin-type N-terminal cleavage/methylation domain-containing protein [Planctomycetota bacterium]
MNDRRGFTLIEILVAVTLSMLMVTVAWNLFSQTQRVARRAQARLQLHAAAKSVYESLRRELIAMQQHCGLWLESKTSPQGVELVFMTAAMDEAGYQMKGTWGNVAVTDLVWSRWRWDGATRRLLCARNVTSRSWPFNTSIDGVPANPSATTETLRNDIQSVRFWPQPRRFTPGDALSGLDDNRWQLTTAGGAAVGAGRNLGDWSDLQQRLSPACLGVESFKIELVLAGRDAGSGNTRTRSADGTFDDMFCAHGIRMDGVSSANVTDAPATVAAAIAGFPAEIGERPAVLRLAFTLYDQAADVRIPFSFSIALPGPSYTP